MKRSASRRFVVVLGVTLPIGAAAVFLLGSDASSGSASPPQARRSVPGSELPSVPVRRPEPASGPAGERGLSRARELRTPETALPRPPRDEREDRRSRLAALVARDPSQALGALLELARSSRDPGEAEDAIDLLLDAGALASRPEAARALVALASSGDEPWRRTAALHALGELPTQTPGRAREVADVARRDADPQVREAAATVLAELAERSPGDVAAAAARSIAADLASETDPAVRSALLGSIRDTRDPAVAETLMNALAGDADPSARQAAAEVLGGVAPANRATALAALAACFGGETDEDVQRTILASIVRAGRSDAIATLESLRASAGALAQDADDYLYALRSGEDDPVRVTAIKEAREAARSAPPTQDD